jgi:hypothetical protein
VLELTLALLPVRAHPLGSLTSLQALPAAGSFHIMNQPTRIFSAVEKGKYLMLKDTVIKGREHARGWVSTLLEIKTTELYKIDYPTWDKWLSEFAPWTIKTIEQLFKEERARLAEHTGEPVIRKTRKYTKKDKPKVVGLHSIHETPTENKNGSSPCEKVEDDMGTIIPKDVLEFWNRRGEITEVLALISRAKCTIEEAQKQGDKLFLKVDQSVAHRLEQVHTTLSRAVPYCVCGECEGRPGNGCAACKSTGFMSREEYTRLVPEQKRMIRQKGIEFRQSKHDPAQLSARMPR